MSKFVKWCILSFTASAATAYATADSLDKFGSILVVSLFSILLATVAAVATKEYVGMRRKAKIAMFKGEIV